MTASGQPVETWEYAELHILDVESLEGRADRRWVIILDQAVTPVIVEALDISAMEVINQFGQDGWIIPGGVKERVENNEVPARLQSFLTGKYGNWGMIRTIDTRWVSRRIVWTE